FTYSTSSLNGFRIGIFCAGLITVAILNFLGNYLPQVYPVYLRGTGEGFAANAGGRMLGTFTSFIVTHLAAMMPGSLPQIKLAVAGATVGGCLYLVALGLSMFLPEPAERIED